MIKRRRFRNTTLEEVLADEAQRLRKETEGILPHYKRERLARKARQAETASHMTRLDSIAWTATAKVEKAASICGPFHFECHLLAQSCRSLRAAANVPAAFRGPSCLASIAQTKSISTFLAAVLILAPLATRQMPSYAAVFR